MATGVQSSDSGFQIPTEIFNDLCSRFIINIPAEERRDLIRVFFQIELAHWFYLDFYCQENTKLKPFGIKEFSIQVFKRCPFLMDRANDVDKHLELWREYKKIVPTFGAILLDPTLQYCLLVQGYYSKNSWGFPKGKVNEGEAAVDCAIREVLEETGFDISSLIQAEEYLEYRFNDQLSQLYIVPNVPTDTKFLPRTRKEIRKLQWFAINTLPAHKKDQTSKDQLDKGPNAFFMIIPFVKPLRKWIGKQLSKSDGHGSAQASMQAQDVKNQLKPVRLFAGGNEGQSSPRKPRSSPKANKKQKQKSEVPTGSKQILTRSGEIIGGPKEKSTQMTFVQPKVWTNFKLDAGSILACF